MPATFVGARDDPPRWPPDLFALVAFLFQQSGAYSRVIDDDWPGPTWPVHDDWKKAVVEAADEWRNAIRKEKASELAWTPPGQTSVPQLVKTLWASVTPELARSPTTLCDPQSDRALCDALVTLLAIADEAAHGAGIDRSREAAFGIGDVREIEAVFDMKATSASVNPLGSTLCSRLVQPGFRVLPKMHTPQTGLTLRSLSNNLAFFVPREVTPRWGSCGWKEEKDASGHHDRSSLSLLLVPWPLEIHPKFFKALPKGKRPDVHEFAYCAPAWTETRAARLAAIISTANEIVDRVDGLIFPEASLTEEGWTAVLRQIEKPSGPRFAIAGVADQIADRRPTNTARFGFVLDESFVTPKVTDKVFSPNTVVVQRATQLRQYKQHVQHKHHRWCLDAGQITQYHLGASLDINQRWWEGIEIPRREVAFFRMWKWLTLSMLICEDLARQDPVSSLVRAVGPNLVVSLLMDGPQIAGRWPGRYATVLADDPGSSVLTISSLGMVRRSRPVGMNDECNRIVAMWKDRSGTCTSINLGPAADAILVTIGRRSDEEFTADGRSDRHRTATLVLTGVHDVPTSAVERHMLYD